MNFPLCEKAGLLYPNGTLNERKFFIDKTYQQVLDIEMEFKSIDPGQVRLEDVETYLARFQREPA